MLPGLSTPRLHTLARAARLTLGCVWATTLLALGLIVWREQPWAAYYIARWTPIELADADRFLRAVSVSAAAAAQFVFMVFVADDLVPAAPWTLRAFGETFFGTLALGGLAAAVLVGWVALHP